MAINQSFYLLSISLIDFNNFCTSCANQNGLRLFEIVKGSDTSRELRHRCKIDDLFLHELTIPEDKLAIVATSNDHSSIHDIDNLPERICVTLDGLAKISAIPYLEFTGGTSSQHDFV